MPPFTEARKKHWLRQDLWTLAEAASLLTGQEPNAQPPSVEKIEKRVRNQNLEVRLEALIKAQAPLAEFRKALEEADSAICRAILAGNLQSEGGEWVRPPALIRWACERGLWPKLPYNISDLELQTWQSKAKSSTKKSRDRDTLAPLLREALKEAKNPNSNAEVLSIFRTWAGLSRYPLLDVTDGEIKWLDEGGDAQFLTKKTLADRLRRIRKSEIQTQSGAVRLVKQR